MTAPLQIAVVGHTNAGKTSLLRTLSRRRDVGEISDRPGTTRHVEAVDLRIDGQVAVRFLDTPGLEDPVGLLDALGPLQPSMTPPQRIRAFLATPDAHDRFEQEAKVLRALLEADAALFVIDCREPVLPKFRCEVEILAACGRPVLPVLNFVRDESRREAAWQALLSDFALHALARFDAVAPFAGAEHRLFRDLQTLLPLRQAELQRVTDHLAAEAQARRHAGREVIAGTLVDVTAASLTLEKDEAADTGRKARQVAAFRAGILARVRRGVQELLQVHTFAPDEADLTVLPWLQGRWEADLFDPETLRDAGKRFGTGAAIGAGVGVALDLAMAGLSLGAATAAGAAIGGAVSQGFGTMGRRLLNKALGREELSLEDAVVLVIAERLLALEAALQTRGHAAEGRIDLEAGGRVAKDDGSALMVALRPARAHPQWARDASSAGRSDAAEAVVAALPAVVGD